jgi:hypothetical protein
MKWAGLTLASMIASPVVISRAEIMSMVARAADECDGMLEDERPKKGGRGGARLILENVKINKKIRLS